MLDLYKLFLYNVYKGVDLLMKNRLSDLRTERSLSQEDLAKQLHCTQQIISHYESGKNSKVSMEFENSICDFFNCSLDYLRCRSAIRNEQKHSETLKKVADMIEEFYNGNENKEKQDLTDEELASFLEFISQFKDLLKKFPK